MHQPASEHQISTIIDGESVCGTVRHGGSTELYVRLDQPSCTRMESVHMPNFARAVHREGFLGEYGEQRAMALLIGLYKEQKTGDRRRRYAGPDYPEFGRIRYVREDPRFPRRGCVIREKAPLNSVIHVQLEDNGPYGLARFFDSATNQPFLAEAAVYEETIQQYLDGIRADLGYRVRLKAARRKALPDMIRYAGLREAYQVDPYQIDLLKEFGQAWRGGDIPLEMSDVEHLIAHGYLIRDAEFAFVERLSLQAAIDRRLEIVRKYEATGQHANAEQCRSKVLKLQRRIEAKTLRVTAAGRAVAESFPHQVW